MWILEPTTSFYHLDKTLTYLGWERTPDADEDPIEPMVAQWTHPDHGAQLTYTYYPATYLRTLQPDARVTEAEVGAIRAELRFMTTDDATRLLTFPDVESLLLGLQIAQFQPDPQLLEPVAALLTHPEPLVAEAAREAFRAVATGFFAETLPILAKQYADKPPEVLAFELLGEPQVKRQVLRWMGYVDIRKRNPTAIVATLHAALKDQDWETRVTAMLMAVRLGATSLAKEIQHVALPVDGHDGIDGDDRRLLMALRDISVGLLQGAPIPPDLSDIPTTRETMWQHLTRCVAGEAVAWHGRGFLLVHALTTPLELPDEIPVTLPDGLIPFDAWVWLGDINLMWVAPIPHWLGDELPKNVVLNPIREHTPPHGFFIAQSPTDTLYTWEEAQAFCTALGKRYGTAVRLPTADEWEMAARGPDGRRFPWGNAFQDNGREEPSPWGLYQTVGIAPQWVTGARGEPLICGDKAQLRCSVRKVPQVGMKAAVRVVVDLS